MAYSTKNCMITKEQAEKILRQEEKRLKALKSVTHRAAQFYEKYKEDIFKRLSEEKKES